jgi:hypothetical protein
MAFLFGGGKPQGKDGMRAYMSEVKSSVRTTEREIAKITRQEAALMTQLKKCQGLSEAQKTARELVRLRAHKGRLDGLRTNMRGLAQQLAEVNSAKATHEIIEKTTKMLKDLNKQLSVKGTHSLMVQWERANTEMQMKQEVADDVMNSVFEAEDEKDATEDVIASVMREAGIDLEVFMLKKGEHAPPQCDTEDLDARLRALRT